MAILRNLEVTWVSLVQRAAVRDPQDPDQPQRFLAMKSDTNEGVTDMSTTELSKAEQTIVELRKAAADTSLSYSERCDAKAASVAAQLELQRSTNPVAAAQYELAHDMSPIEKSDVGENDVALLKKAEKIRKRDPSMTPYDAMLQAARGA